MDYGAWVWEISSKKKARTSSDVAVGSAATPGIDEYYVRPPTIDDNPEYWDPDENEDLTHKHLVEYRKHWDRDINPNLITEPRETLFRWFHLHQDTSDLREKRKSTAGEKEAQSDDSKQEEQEKHKDDDYVISYATAKKIMMKLRNKLE